MFLLVKVCVDPPKRLGEATTALAPRGSRSPGWPGGQPPHVGGVAGTSVGLFPSPVVYYNRAPWVRFRLLSPSAPTSLVCFCGMVVRSKVGFCCLQGMELGWVLGPPPPCSSQSLYLFSLQFRTAPELGQQQRAEPTTKQTHKHARKTNQHRRPTSFSHPGGATPPEARAPLGPSNPPQPLGSPRSPLGPLGPP